MIVVDVEQGGWALAARLSLINKTIDVFIYITIFENLTNILI